MFTTVHNTTVFPLTSSTKHSIRFYIGTLTASQCAGRTVITDTHSISTLNEILRFLLQTGRQIALCKSHFVEILHLRARIS